jgi:hypothetical protein
LIFFSFLNLHLSPLFTLLFFCCHIILPKVQILRRVTLMI